MNFPALQIAFPGYKLSKSAGKLDAEFRTDLLFCGLAAQTMNHVELQHLSLPQAQVKASPQRTCL